MSYCCEMDVPATTAASPKETLGNVGTSECGFLLDLFTVVGLLNTAAETRLSHKTFPSR